ncbi:MAG: hypothetical protein OEV01_13860 [Nitrospira sp.]|nr:hypothetical protein [Nitrospira sp.]MDH4305497.1 hypothetical protein [Nitrospira sp.]MDH5195297.1 hypothetical protein [Nitrospira sp.]
MARALPPSEQPNTPASSDNPSNQAWEVELLRVLVSRKGTRVEAQWAIHPQLKQDLLPAEWLEVVDLMTKATDIVGERFSKSLADVDLIPPGNA